MTTEARRLVLADLVKRAKAAGMLCRFDAHGCAVIVIPDDAEPPKTEGNPAPESGGGDALPGLQGGPSGDGPGQGPRS